MRRTHHDDEFATATKKSAGLLPAGLWLFVFSVAANLLMLAMPIYLAQIYDKVLPGESLETLFYLSVIIVGALALFGLMETLRSRIAQKMSARFELAAAPALVAGAVADRRASVPSFSQGVKDVATIRQFLASRGFIGLFDLPFAPFFLLLLALVHPVLGAIACVGAGILVALAFANEALARGAQARSTDARTGTNTLLSGVFRRIDDVRALGLGPAIFARWQDQALVAAKASEDGAVVNAGFFGLVRFIRQSMQILILGAGAYLVVTSDLSAGLIFAASIVSGRALQPIEQVIGSWRQIGSARAAWKRVNENLGKIRDQSVGKTLLKDPKGELTIDRLVYASGSSDSAPILKGLSFSATPGEVMTIIGPSGAGKSTLIRLLAGILPSTRGRISLDGFEIDTWDATQLGRHIGYVGQETEFFQGTVADNIARLDPEATDHEVIAAAERAGVHEFIGALPNGYDTLLGAEGVRLSGGQKQRIALARAFYRDPPVILLDEPDAHLDGDGEAGLREALSAARDRQKTIIVVTQRNGLLDLADTVLVVRDGLVEAFGPKSEVLRPKSVPPRRIAGKPTTAKPLASAQTGSTEKGGQQSFNGRARFISPYPGTATTAAKPAPSRTEQVQ